MQNFYEPISFIKHADMFWTPPTVFEFAREVCFVPITLAEIRRSALSFPLCIRRIGDIFDVVAILADTEGRNIHVDALGKWTSDYIPLTLRVYPFSLVRSADNMKPRLAVTHEESLFGPHGDYPVFANKQQLSPATTTIFELLLAAEEQQKNIHMACSAIMESQITTQVPPGIFGTRALRQRLFVIDREKLSHLSSDAPEWYQTLYNSHPFSLHLAEIIAFSQHSLTFRLRNREMVEGMFTPVANDAMEPGQLPPDEYENLIDYDDKLEFF